MSRFFILLLVGSFIILFVFTEWIMYFIDFITWLHLSINSLHCHSFILLNFYNFFFVTHWAIYSAFTFLGLNLFYLLFFLKLL
jgi:hypothetical protein